MRCTVHVTVGVHMCTKCHCNIFGSCIKDKNVKFSKNCATFTIKESGGGESTNYGILKDNNINKLPKYFMEVSKIL